MNLINHSGNTVTPHIVYIAKFNWWHEDFVKVGITSKTVEERYAEERTYQLGEYKTFQCQSELEALGIESAVLKIMYPDKVTPRMYFNGYSECLKIGSFDMAVQVTENLMNKYINNTDNKKEEMKELIKVETNSSGQQIINAKDLYDGLGLAPAHWKRWYNTNIVNNKFAFENDDWWGFTIGVNGNDTMNFYLKLDFAKKLAMKSNTEKGEQYREYFLLCERKIFQVTLPSYQIEDEVERALAWAQERKIERERLQLKQEENKYLKSRQGAINDTKAATAMGKVGGLSKSNNVMKEQLGKSDKYSTINHVKEKTGIAYQSYWLIKYCNENGLEIKEVKPLNLTVKSYPYDAWLNVYAVDLKKLHK